jgi:hypothetical protein
MSGGDRPSEKTKTQRTQILHTQRVAGKGMQGETHARYTLRYMRYTTEIICNEICRTASTDRP